MKITKLLASLCIGASTLLLATASANPRELKLAVGLAPASAFSQGMEMVAKTLKEKSGGELEVKVFPMALLSPPQMLAGVRDGVVDIGWVLSPVFPSELPETNLASNLVMLGINPWAMAGAMTEYVFTCQECIAEHLKQNHVYLGSASTQPMVIISTKKIVTLDEVKGKKLRSPAAPWARWAQNFGAVAMSIPPHQVFEAMSAGTVDGAMGTPSNLSDFRLFDVAKHVTTGTPTGTYLGIENNNFNLKTWRSLTERQRKAVLEASAMSSAAVTWKTVVEGIQNMKDAQQKGIQVHQAPADVVARTKAFIESDMATIAQAAEKNSGIKNATQKIARFRQLVEKWEKLTPDQNWEPKALADIYYREIYSKIDPKTHGM